MQGMALIGLGSNLPFGGESGSALLAHALGAVKAAGFAPRAVSGVWLTAPWPPRAQPDYHNAAAAIDPQGFSPQALYDVLRTIEFSFGRERRDRWESRTLDLDLLAMDGFVGGFGEISLPHPRLHERGFVLAPLAEIVAEWRHPILGKTAAEMLSQLSTDQRAQRIGDLTVA
jgi:2-amino-4-hydroxy-6-hydroxymethyldihydropteridine diphosphokinase